MRVYRRGKRGTYYAEFRDPLSGREVRRSLRVTSRRVASHLAAELAEQVARRYHRLAERKPWGEAVAAYLAHGEVHKDRATVAKDRRTLTKHFVFPEVVRYVDDLRAEHVAAHVAACRARGLSPSTINRELRIVRAFLNWSSLPSRRWTPENPAREVPMLAEPQGVAARPMTDEELHRLLQAVEGTRLEGPVLLALNHGLRGGEVIHLRRDAVDPVGGILYIRHDPPTGWKVKGGRERVIYLNEVTRAWLARHLAEPQRSLSPYLFSGDFGGPWSREALVMRVGRLMRGVGIAKGGLHRGRHTWATKQAEAGTPMSVLKAMGGWRDWRSMEFYLHHGDEAQRQAASRVVIGLQVGKVVPLGRRRLRS